MPEAANDTILVTLMGPPRIHKQPKPTPAQQQANDDPEALELIALLLLSLPTDGVADLGKTQFFERDWLVTTLYPDQFAATPQPARDHLRHKLRQVTGALSTKLEHPGMKRARGRFGLDLAHVRIDVQEMLSAARHLHTETHQDAVIACGAARLLKGMNYPWLVLPAMQELRRRLDDIYLDALCRKTNGLLVKMDAAVTHGDFDRANTYRNDALPLIDQALTRLRALKAAHPLAPQFSRFEARAAHLMNETFLLASAPPTLPPGHNLPHRPTSFVGRAQELARLDTLLGDARIVTITGMGGCGKTRLALQAARRYAARDFQETGWVELAGVRDPALLPEAVAAALGLPEQKRTAMDALIDRFRTGPMLLLLDNCEHLRAACATLVDTLAQACPLLTVLTTSRRPLRVDGEYLLALAPLRVPPPDPAFWKDASVEALMEYESARLFVDRMRLHDDFPVAPQHVAAIASICASLDGIPLALELAAARTHTLTLSQVDELLTDRFDLLTNGRTTAPARHKTLRAVIDWSYDLLTDRERTLLCRCSVFAGGWTLEAAQSVGASEDLPETGVRDVLSSLVEQSLVIADTHGATGRYRMLETVRQYANDQLRERGARDGTRLRHRDFFAALAADVYPHLAGPEPGAWLDRLDIEFDNLRLALEWRADQEGMRLACDLRSFWQIRSHFQEGRRWLERAWDDSVDLPVEIRACALVGAGRLAFDQSHFQEAERLCNKSLQLYAAVGDRAGMADALYHLGVVATNLGNYRDAETRLQECLTLSLDSGNEGSIAHAHYGLGRLAHIRSDYTCADGHFAVCLRLWRKVEDAVNLAILLTQMGLHAAHQNQRAEAHAMLTESLALQSQFGSPQRHGKVLGALAELARIEGDHLEARRYGEQSIIYLQKVGDRIGIANMTNILALTAMEEGDFLAAEKGFAQSQSMFVLLENERIAAAISVNLASAVGKQGKYDRALTLFQESLMQLHGFDAWEWIGNVVEEIGLLEAEYGLSLRAATLLSAADMILKQMSYSRSDPEEARVSHALSKAREKLGDPAFEAAYNAGRAMTKEQAYAFALKESLPASLNE